MSHFGGSADGTEGCEAITLEGHGTRQGGKPGLYGDGAGLALRIGPKGATAWALRYMRQGAAREMGLGPVHTIGLAEARERARRHRHTLVPFGTNRCVVEATV